MLQLRPFLHRTAASWILAVSLLCLSAGAKDWPEFRGPGGEGHSDAEGVPIEWSEKKNVAWKKPMPGSGWSSPVLVDGKLYLTTAVPTAGSDGPQAARELRVLCINSKDGEIIWDREVFGQGGAGTPNIHKKNSHASPTPIVEGDRIYVHFGHQGTACLAKTGEVLWQNREIKYPPVHGGGGSPVIAGDKLIFTCDGKSEPRVVALSKRDGKLAWTFKRDTKAKKKFSFATPLVIDVAGKKQVIAPGSGGVSSLDPESGEEIWFVDYGEGYSVIPRPVYGHGMVFLSSGYDRPVAYGIKVDGKGDVTESHVVWETNRRAPNTPSMLLVGEELYMISDGGVATCLDAKSGDEHWSERTGAGMSASPVFAEGRIYIQDEKGVTKVLEAGTEFNVLVTNRIEGRTLASFAVDDGAIYIRSETHLYRIGKGE